MEVVYKLIMKSYELKEVAMTCTVMEMLTEAAASDVASPIAKAYAEGIEYKALYRNICNLLGSDIDANEFIYAEKTNSYHYVNCQMGKVDNKLKIAAYTLLEILDKLYDMARMNNNVIQTENSFYSHIIYKECRGLAGLTAIPKGEETERLVLGKHISFKLLKDIQKSSLDVPAIYNIINGYRKLKGDNAGSKFIEDLKDTKENLSVLMCSVRMAMGKDKELDLVGNIVEEMMSTDFISVDIKVGDAIKKSAEYVRKDTRGLILLTNILHNIQQIEIVFNKLGGIK